MTIEERDTMRAIQTIAKEMKKPRSIDWEQRRYEIAKELFPGRIASCCGNPYAASEEAVNYADILIEELKKERN